jgi:hypothetical protein
LLPIVQLRVEANGRSWIGYGLLDPGSQVFMITKALADELKLQGDKKTTRTGTYHGRNPTATTAKVLFKISSF